METKLAEVQLCERPRRPQTGLGWPLMASVRLPPIHDEPDVAVGLVHEEESRPRLGAAAQLHEAQVEEPPEERQPLGRVAAE
eukprot:10652567-Alexandrium_andersonii.AAC.1